MSNIMCDLETLATDEKAVIISIGLVYFDVYTQRLGEELYIELSLDAVKDQQNKGRTVSLDTLSWWMQQSDEVRKVWKNNNEEHRINNNKAALDKMHTYFRLYDEKVNLWGNGSTFDNVILRSYFNTFGQAAPWHYAGDLCYRTMKRMFGHKAKLERIGEHHNALADSKTQALHLLNMFKRIS